MRVLYDGEKFETQTAGGISAYFGQLISHLPDGVEATIALRQAVSLYLPDQDHAKRIRPRAFRSKLLSWWAERATFGAALRSGRYDLIHPTYYRTVMIDDVSRLPGRVALTVHDMVHEIFHDRIDPYGTHAAIKRRAIDRADAIICVSENTKRDLQRFYRVPDDRISVIYEAPVVDATGEADSEEPVPELYFLYVGSRDAAYKNFALALDGIAALTGRFPDLRLLVVGSPFEDVDRQEIGRRNLADRVVHLGHLSTARLAGVYRGSLALLYPSLYEGFGIPPLEAMACGTPVIASSVASLPEVVGDAGFLIETGKPDDFVDAMTLVLTDERERQRIVELGRRRVGMFNWTKTAAETASVYRSLLA